VKEYPSFANSHFHEICARWQFGQGISELAMSAARLLGSSCGAISPMAPSMVQGHEELIKHVTKTEAEAEAPKHPENQPKSSAFHLARPFVFSHVSSTMRLSFVQNTTLSQLASRGSQMDVVHGSISLPCVQEDFYVTDETILTIPAAAIEASASVEPPKIAAETPPTVPDAATDR
jgi:hypothetical protein